MYLTKIILAGCLLGSVNIAYAQPKIEGPTCVMPGVEYLYKVNLKPDTPYRVCAFGGSLKTGDQCTSDSVWQKYLYVIWRDSVGTKLEMNISGENLNFPVIVTTLLQGGQLHDSDLVKTFDGSSSYFLFRCTEATGGNCAPIYTYQWQRSVNGLNWINIPGANGRDLIFHESITVTTQFRRLTQEAGANTVAYSNSALLLVE